MFSEGWLKALDGKKECGNILENSGKKAISDILRDLLGKPIDIIRIHRLFNEFQQTEAWKSYEKFRSKEEVQDTARYIKRLAKARVEIGFLGEYGKWIVVGRVEPVALIRFKGITATFEQIAELYEKLREKNPKLIVDINVFEYSEEKGIVDVAEEMALNGVFVR